MLKMDITKEQQINERIAHLKVLIPFLKSKPIYDANKIPDFKAELKHLKNALKMGC